MYIPQAPPPPKNKKFGYPLLMLPPFEKKKNRPKYKIWQRMKLS